MRRTLAVTGAAFALLLVAPVAASAAPGTPSTPAVRTAASDLVRSKEYWLSSYGILQAWNTTQGRGVTVAIIDTGVDGSVPELRGAVVGGTDFSHHGASNGQTPVGSGEDSDHGTMVASLLAGRGTGPGTGAIGVAPQASLLSISIGFGAQAPDSDDQIADAVTWAVDHGARVINMSLTRNTLSWPPAGTRRSSMRSSTTSSSSPRPATAAAAPTRSAPPRRCRACSRSPVWTRAVARATTRRARESRSASPRRASTS
ncbi:hypothetical protein GCM10025881_29690 [Pseudolysinimonas kribbensis]|uniref:Peptidase S8/S53 domain-containing protein n=1 Tax=Pseudolysinimonas kribbensis TaxID=433641 RepID=A0ABQ6KBC2_9MICO|nr:hypothetical protein GCM10025881_29690 [Pseudolysinimonas kribbensis]